jgi:hypothetical protein
METTGVSVMTGGQETIAQFIRAGVTTNATGVSALVLVIVMNAFMVLASITTAIVSVSLAGLTTTV